MYITYAYGSGRRKQLFDITGLKRGFDEYGGREEHRRDRRDDFLADDGRSLFSAGSKGEKADVIIH